MKSDRLVEATQADWSLYRCPSLFLALLLCTNCLLFVRPLPAQTWEEPPEILAGTERLMWDDKLDVRLMDGAHRYIERKISQSATNRQQYWSRDLSSRIAYEQSVSPNRERLRTIIGAVDRGHERNHNIGLPAVEVPVRMERVGDDDRPAMIYANDSYQIWRVRWPVLTGVCAEGLLLEPCGKPTAHVVLLPDAEEFPEQMAGLVKGIPADRHVALRLVKRGVRVLARTLHPRIQLAH
ncbi:hypothetical protein CA13_64130 [Planctomycetes bacterium CA13]|uniref:Uncharacterized protein n=1 Tax=Novipirellula herctigrandis TaxID=2527986 RepID=A0A5C5ZC87_9BACT|nr:hypothetical protein CA13_64130 [Planctomycetes bacterium CA13]